MLQFSDLIFLLQGFCLFLRNLFQINFSQNTSQFCICKRIPTFFPEGKILTDAIKDTILILFLFFIFSLFFFTERFPLNFCLELPDQVTSIFYITTFWLILFLALNISFGFFGWTLTYLNRLCSLTWPFGNFEIRCYYFCDRTTKCLHQFCGKHVELLFLSFSNILTKLAFPLFSESLPLCGSSVLPVWLSYLYWLFFITKIIITGRVWQLVYIMYIHMPTFIGVCMILDMLMLTHTHFCPMIF